MEKKMYITPWLTLHRVANVLPIATSLQKGESHLSASSFDTKENNFWGDWDED